MISKLLSYFVRTRHIITEEEREKSFLTRQMNKNKKLQLQLQEQQLKDMAEQLKFKQQERQFKLLQKQIDDLDDNDDIDEDNEEDNEEDLSEDNQANQMFQNILMNFVNSKIKPQPIKVENKSYSEEDIIKVINTIPENDFKKIKKLPEPIIINYVKGLGLNLTESDISKILNIIKNK